MNICDSYIVWFTIVVIVLKIYQKLWVRRNESSICLIGKTVIVTGANTGIGYYSALDFATRGAKVILACRNKEKAEDAQRKIIKATQNSRIIYKLVDFASLESVRSLAKDINDTEERIDILVNNAGTACIENFFTKDGVQVLLQVNHIAGFLLTHLLIDKMKLSAPSRIVNVASMAALFSNFNIETMNQFTFAINLFYSNCLAYCNSKLCNILFTIALANRLKGTGLTVNAIHPGCVRTELFREMPWIQRKILGIGQFYFKTAEEGAQTTIYVAVSEKLNGVTGKLFDNCKESGFYWTTKDPILAEKVWQKSETLAKLNTNEKIK